MADEKEPAMIHDPFQNGDPVVEVAKIIAASLGKPNQYQTYIGAGIGVCAKLYPVKPRREAL